MNTFTTEQITGLGFTNWLEETSNRGWFTCTLTSKKFRGEQAAAMLANQQRAVSEYEARQELVEAEAAGTEKADAEQMAMALGQAALKSAGIKAPVAEIEALEEIIEADRSITERLQMHVMEKAVAGQPVKTTQIACEDCGTKRSIKVQDVFQVTRCVVCQKQHRNRKRADRRRQQRLEAKEQE